MSITLALALALLIVSLVMAILYQAWSQPLLWVAWALAVVVILGPAIGLR
jgi:hypothetical protein